MTLTATDSRHGTYNGYQNHGCRCDPCREAAALYRLDRDMTGYGREWRHRTGRNKPMEVHLAEVAAKHGTESRYSRGCRCSDCKQAATTARRVRRNENLEASRAYYRAYSARKRAAS